MIWTVLHFMHWISSMKLFLRPKTLWSKKWFMEMKRICFIALVVVCGGKYSLSQIDFYQYSIQQKLSIFTNREIMQQSCKKNKRFKNNFIWIPSQPSNRIVLVQASEMWLWELFWTMWSRREQIYNRIRPVILCITILRRICRPGSMVWSMVWTAYSWRCLEQLSPGKLSQARSGQMLGVWGAQTTLHNKPATSGS